MPSRYDASTKAKGIRLVREQGGDYPTQWAAITAVSGRLGMSAETLRKWVRQADVDEGKAPGMTSAESAEIRELRRKNRELEQIIEILKAAASFSRGSATRDSDDLPVHRRGKRDVRGRTGLPGAFGARHRNRPAHLPQGSGVFSTYLVVSGMWLIGLTRAVCRYCACRNVARGPDQQGCLPAVG